MTEREAFEAWASRYSASRLWTRPFTDECYEAWQASRQQAFIEAAAVCLSPEGRDVGMTGANCADAIRALSAREGGQ